MRRVLLLSGMLVLVGNGDAPAQTPAQAESFAWVRAAPASDVGAAVPSTLGVNALLALQVRRGQGSWARRGAVLGALAGGIATYFVIHHGGSTSLCDRSANQDAMGKRECVAVTVGGAAAGAGLGAWLGSRFRRY